MTEESRLRKAHADLLACYKDIRQEFTDLDCSTLTRFLGKYNSAHFRQQVREHGDGYTMRSVPSSADEILCADEIVLIVMNSPKLDDKSVFRLHASLPEIPYWKYGMKGLRPEARLCGNLTKFQFLVWEQKCGVHGETTPNALENQHLLLRQRPHLRQLIPSQARKSDKLLWSCMGWLENLDRRLVVLTDARRKDFCPPIPQLLRDDSVLHISTELYRKRKDTIMNEIIRKLSEGS